MCRLVIGTPCSDSIADMTTAEFNLGVITHVDGFGEFGESG
jgi:hypothetical protein